MQEHQSSDPIEEDESNQEEKLHSTIHLSGMYENWFLDYASYVILERAVPEVLDGLKPVQRRILHAMKDLDDGRYNKVANIIGHTMQYHPHGDASIGDALVQLGQKDLLIDCQGNWGNIHTGDRAAAARYIEARLSKFALEVVFNPKTTKWKASYDGRKKEPTALPVKFPLLLAQGVEGIAVGLASKILPHNFNELIDAAIKHLRGRSFELYPDFLTGGMADISKYNKGLRGGKVRIRARIEKVDKKTLIINELPFAVTTSSLIDSIITANEKGKIKIKKIEDNTAENVEIVVHLPSGTSPDQTIDALYAFTSCEVSISPNNCVIEQEKPSFLDVDEILIRSVENTKELLNTELKIQEAEILESHLFSSLEKIFIENRIYRDIEECETWESVIDTIDKGLEPFKKQFYRVITRDDIVRLTEIKIKRISKFDSFKADDIIKALEDDLKEVRHHLAHLVEYSIAYYKRIKKKFGKGRERKTELRSFDNIDATQVAVANQKLYLNREEGFVGTSLKKSEYICDCSDLDEIAVIRTDGKLIVVKVSDKTFIGKEPLYVGVYKRKDNRTVFNMIYKDGPRGKNYIKRFMIGGIILGKEYDLCKGSDGSKILYLTENLNGEAEKVRIKLRAKPKLKKLSFDVDFADISIKGRSTNGNILSKHTISKISLVEEGVSTLGAIDIYFDEAVNRLNTEENGRFLGSFASDDQILVVKTDGSFYLTDFSLTNRYDYEIYKIEKFQSDKIWSVVYLEPDSGLYYIKRFKIEANDKVNFFIPEANSKVILISDHHRPVLELFYGESGHSQKKSHEELNVEEFIGVKSVKARGKRLSKTNPKKLIELDPLPYEKPKEETVEKEVDIVVEEVPKEKIEVKKEEKVEDKKSKEVKKDETVTFEVTNPSKVDVKSTKNKDTEQGDGSTDGQMTIEFE